MVCHEIGLNWGQIRIICWILNIPLSADCTVKCGIDVLFDYNLWFPKVSGIPTYTGALLFMVKLELFKVPNHRRTSGKPRYILLQYVKCMCLFNWQKPRLFVPTPAQGVQQTCQGGKFSTLYCMHTLIRFPAPYNF